MAEPGQPMFDWNAAHVNVRRSALIVLVFLVLGLVLYLPALRAYFVCDDFLHVARVIKGGLPFTPGNEAGPAFLRPIVGLSFVFDYALWGRDPFGYHFANVLVHIGNSLLVGLLAYQLCGPDAKRRRLVAVGSGLVFLTLACHAEPVSWISGRTDVYATFFMLVSLISASAGLRTNSLPALWTSLVALALALLTKESALALPFLLALLALFYRVQFRLVFTPRHYRWGLSICACFVTYFLIRYAALGTPIGGYGARGHLRLSRDLLAQSTSRFAWRTFLPPLPESMSAWFVSNATLLGILWLGLLLVGLTALAVITARKRRAFLPLFLVLSFWAALLPVLNIRIQWTNPESERFLYLATVFAAILVAWLIATVPLRSLRLALLLLFIGIQGLWLHGAVNRWHTASLIARDIVYDIQEQVTEGEVVLVNKPDSYDGALVLRSGLAEGLHHFGEGPNPSLVPQVLYAATLFQPNHGMELTAEGDGTYRARATDPTSVMAEEDRGDLIETVSTDGRVCIFRFREPLRAGPIFYYDGGDVKKSGT